LLPLWTIFFPTVFLSKNSGLITAPEQLVLVEAIKFQSFAQNFLINNFAATAFWAFCLNKSLGALRFCAKIHIL
jgi:hypothetical protein